MNNDSHAKVRHRILLTSRSGQVGGMELRLVDEARFLDRAGWECVLAPSRFEARDPWLDRVLEENPAFRYLDFEPAPFFEEWPWRRLNLVRAGLRWPRDLRRRRFSLAHVFYAWTQEGGSRLFLLSKAGIPCVLSIHNTFPEVDFGRWHARITSRSFSAVRGIYAVSDSALKNFLATYGRYIPESAHVTVIPNFVDVRKFVPCPETRRIVRSELGIPADAPVVGSVGRVAIQKQPLHVLDVFERVWRDQPESHLVFCGSGPMERQVREAVAARPWAAQVRLLGFRQDVHRIYPALDVHLLLSKQEGFGISTAEAMACGVPVVATNVPGTRDVLRDGHAGILVPFGDTGAAAAAAARILDSKSLARAYGENGVREASALYSKEVWQSRLQDFYCSVFASIQL